VHINYPDIIFTGSLREPQRSRERTTFLHPWYIIWLNEIVLKETTKFKMYSKLRGYAVAKLIEELRYKSEGRGFDSLWYHLNFLLTYPSGRTRALWSTQPGTDISTRNISWGGGGGGHLHVPIDVKSGSLNLLEPSGPVQGLLYLFTSFPKLLMHRKFVGKFKSRNTWR